MTNDNWQNEILKTVGNAAVQGALNYTIGSSGTIVSRYGKKLIDYWVDNSLGNHQPKNENTQQQEKEVPPFVVVGLGRCGCHVAAELAQLIELNQPLEQENRNLISRRNILSLFGNPENSAVFKFDPIMLVGDIDETTYGDVDGLLRGVSKETKDKLLRLDYQPLAEGGVGHVPVFAEFLTKSLLLLPQNSQNIKDNSTRNSQYWNEAREFLTTFSSEEHDIPRLVFYIFSTGGGTGAGSASEMMKAQSYAKIRANIDREMYFTGTAIFPEDIGSDRRKLINTGRTVVQYLADLNIQLETTNAYDEAPNCIASSYITIEDSSKGKVQEALKVPVMPWNGLAFISNDVMNASSMDSRSFEKVEDNANKYIAQQMFNLAAAQYSAAGWEKDNEDKNSSTTPQPTEKNYKAIRLDPNDLKTGLIGPYAIAFSVLPLSNKVDEEDTDIIDEMILRAISLPRYCNQFNRESPEDFLIEGISIAPDNKQKYVQIINNIHDLKKEEGLSEKSFEELRKIRLFEKCPRVICSFTAPQRSSIPNMFKERMETLIEWLFPNLNQTRYAISWGTTKFYSLSIYIESSVLLVPDVQKSILSYLKLCWKARRSSTQEFKDTYRKFVEQEPPILDEEIEQWLGKTENYGAEIPNFNNLSRHYDSKWFKYVEQNCKDNKKKEDLKKNEVKDVYLNHNEIASALRYINYAFNQLKIEDIGDFDI